MLWILLVICIVVEIWSLWSDELTCFAPSALVVVALITFAALFSWNTTHSTAVKQISVLEERKVDIIASLDPVVDKYLGYETDTVKALRVSDLKVAVQLYPELKGNEFVMKQLDTLNDIESQITKLKLDMASLNAYKLLIFLGE